MAVLDHEHFRLKMMYKEKKIVDAQLVHYKEMKKRWDVSQIFFYLPLFYFHIHLETVYVIRFVSEFYVNTLIEMYAAKDNKENRSTDQFFQLHVECNICLFNLLKFVLFTVPES